MAPAALSPIGLIGAAGLLPVLRTSSAEATLTAIEAVMAARLPVVELTTTTPGWEEVARQTSRGDAEVVVGVGTVTSASVARAALAAGAAFLVSPFPCPEVRAVAHEAGVPFLEGGFTPGEVAAATARGPAKESPLRWDDARRRRERAGRRPDPGLLAVPQVGCGSGDFAIRT